MQSYRSSSHVKLKFRTTCTVLQAITTQSSDKIFLFNYSNPFLLSYIIEIHGVTKVKYNYCLNREKFSWLLLHVQMITGV